MGVKINKASTPVILLNSLLLLFASSLAVVYIHKIHSYGFWKRIFNDFNVFYDADSPAMATYIMEPFQSVALRHPLRDFYLYPFHLFSRWVPMEILLIFATTISLVVFILVLGKSTQIMRDIFLESKLYLMIPLLSTCTLTWIFIPESFLISGALIFVAIVIAAHTQHLGWLFLSGFLASGMNILGFIPWIIVILGKRNLRFINRIGILTLVGISELAWIFFGKILLNANTNRSVDFPSNIHGNLDANLAPSSTVAFLHSPLDYWQHAIVNYLTVPWISAFGNSNPRILLPLVYILFSLGLSFLSFYGLLIGTRTDETKLRMISKSLLIFDFSLFPVFLSFGFIHDGFLFAPLIFPGRIFGLLLSFTLFRSKSLRSLVSICVPLLAIATILSDIYT